MLTTFQKDQLTYLIMDIIECEKQLDQLREQISQNPLFSLRPIYLRFDQSKQGFIDRADFLQFCEDNQITISTREAYMLLKWFDKNKDGKVTFDDFTKSLLPINDSQTRVLIVLREPYFMDKNTFLPQIIEKSISAFLVELIKHMRIQQDIKVKLLNTANFNVFNAYNQIDNVNQGQIHYENLSQFLSDKVNQNDLTYFFWAVNQSKEGKISCSEFIELLMNAALYWFELEENQSQSQPPSIQNQQIQKQNIILPTNNMTTNMTTQSANLTTNIPSNISSNTNTVTKTINNMATNMTISTLLDQNESKPIRYDQIKPYVPQVLVNVEKSQEQAKNEQYTPFKPLESKISIKNDINLTITKTVQKTPEQSIVNSAQLTFQKTNKFKQDDNSKNQIQQKQGSETKTNNEYQQYLNQVKKKGSKMTEQIYCIKNQSKSHQEITYSMFRLLLKQLLLLREIEEQKRQLALRQDFNLLDAFRLFDKDGNGYATISNLQLGLEELGLKVLTEHINLIVIQYSKQNDGVLKYSDFTKMILSSNPDYQILLQNRSPTFEQLENICEIFSSTTMQYLQDLFHLLITTEITIEKYKEDINQDSQEIFKILDQDEKGYLNETDIRNLFALNDVHPTAQEIRRIILR